MAKRPAKSNAPKSGLQQVALLAGVSSVTVARTFAGNAPVAEATRKRVLAAAKKVNYHPNLLARSLRSGKTQSIGVLWELGGPQASVHMTRSLTIRFQKRSYLTSVMDAIHDDATLLDAIHDLSQRQVDGLVIQWGPPAPAKGKRLLTLLKDFAAAVFVTHESQRLPADEIVQDRYNAIRSVAKHFVKTGRSRPAIMIPLPTGYEKSRVFADELSRGNIDPSLIQTIDTPWVSDAQVHYDRLESRFPHGSDVLSQVDALFCGSDEAAVAAMAWSRSRGIRVPDDIAVVGFNDSDGAKFLDPALATVDRRDEEVAAMVEQMIFARFENPNLPFQRAEIPMRFVWRDSAG